MPKPHLLASGIVAPADGTDPVVVAFVAVNFGVEGSRLFKLGGFERAPVVTELPAATTIDLGVFRREVDKELASVSAATSTDIGRPDPGWVCQRIKEHLRAAEGIDLDAS